MWTHLQVFTLLRNIFHFVDLFPLKFISVVIIDVPPEGPQRGAILEEGSPIPLQRWVEQFSKACFLPALREGHCDSDRVTHGQLKCAPLFFPRLCLFSQEAWR